MGQLGRLPFSLGGHLIDLLGHMRPGESLRCSLDGISIAAPVGLGHLVDPKGNALRAWDHFGFGFLEVGPVRAQSHGVQRLDRDLGAQTLTMGHPLAGEACEALATRLHTEAACLTTPLRVRLLIESAMLPVEAARWVASCVRELQPRATGYNTERESISSQSGWEATDWQSFWSHLKQLLSDARPQARLWWVCDTEVDPIIRPLGASNKLWGRGVRKL